MPEIFRICVELLTFCCAAISELSQPNPYIRLVMAYGSHNIGLIVSEEYAVTLRMVYPTWPLTDFLEAPSKNAPIPEPISEGESFGCALLCGDTEESPDSRGIVTAFTEANVWVAKHFCKPCVSEAIEYVLAECSDPRAIHPKPKPISLLVCGATMNVPLGGVIFTLCNEDEHFRLLATRWMEAMLNNTIYYNHVITECCPNHPANPFMRPSTLPIPCPIEGCDMHVCAECHRWHHKSSPCDVDDMPRCPACQRLTVRSEGCDRIHCPCGQQWCYICGQPFGSDFECYDHLMRVHMVELPLNVPLVRDLLAIQKALPV
jgi:hypothetical protein